MKRFTRWLWSVQFEWAGIAFVFLLFAIGNAADYFYQADIHGWFNPLWENGFRAPEYEFFLIKWIPRDGWHAAQMLRNGADKLAALALAFILAFNNRTRLDWTIVLLGVALLIALYAGSRGATFSIMNEIWN